MNEKEAHTWRFKTLRLLAAPQPPEAISNMQRADRDHLSSREAACYASAMEFVDSPARYLVKPSPLGDSSLFEELLSVVQFAGKLSTKMWSRRTTLRVLGLSDLRDVPFSSRLEVVRAHPLHRLFDDDDKCDGWPIGIVVHPAVLGFGTSDGREYGQSTGRVWMKAEVWLVERA